MLSAACPLFTAVTEEQKKRRFNLADADEDGGLTQDEMVSMFHPEEKPHMFDVVVDVRVCSLSFNFPNCQ